jgi:hypothetical protein
VLIHQTLDCPYCGEPNDVAVDPAGGKRQSYEEDCQVCCRPWSVNVRIDGAGEAWIRLAAQDDVEDNE